MKVVSMNVKSVFAAVGMFAAGILSAATLNVDLTVTHGVYSDGELVASRKVVFLVIDRSYSMCEHTLKDGRTPDEALFDSLKMQLNAIPSGTEVHIVPFSANVWEEIVYKNLDEAVRKKILDFVKKATPKGQTVLYDAQDVALTAAAKIMTENANAEVRVLVYTDGEHLTPWNYEGEYKACFQRKAGGLGRRRFENNPLYQEERAAAKKKFEERWRDLMAMPRMAVEYEWLSSSPKPEGVMVTETPIETDFSSQPRDARLKNPLMEPAQDLKCRLHLPITDDMWKQVVGKNVSLDFDVGGKHVTKALVLKEGANVCKLEWPFLPENKPSTVRLALSHMPSGKKFILKEPKPIVMAVPAQACLAVTIESPANGRVFPIGADVEFRAKASEPDAEVKWTVGKSEVLKGNSVKWQAKASGITEYRVTASKTGFRSAESKGSFEVIPTGVTLASESARHEVGKESVFTAKAVGPCIRYEWTVDGKPVMGETATMKHVFNKSGSHRVCVTAIYKGAITAADSPLDISVSAAPLVEILSPVEYDGDAENAQLQAEKPIPLSARIEGDLTTVSWQFKLKDKVQSVQTVVAGGQTAGQFIPSKGGFYDVVATAKGPAGEKSAAVQIFVKSTEVQVAIESPKANQDVANGQAFDLVAVVKGPVKNVRWKMVNKSTGKPVRFGSSDVSPVVNGKSAPVSAKLPLELGNASVEVTAEPVFDDEELSDSAVSASVTIDAVTEAAMAYTPETLAYNWKNVKYGTQVPLAVSVSGAILEVAWFTLDEKGNEKKIGSGQSINVSKEVVYGQRECHIDYFAKGLMPDGKWVKAPFEFRVGGVRSRSEGENITIVWYCPSIEPKIVLPNNEADFGIDEEIVFKVISGNKDRCELTDDDVAEIRWDFGDGTIETNNHVSTKHVFRKLSEAVTVSVQTVCKKCGEIEPHDKVEMAGISRRVVCSCVCAEIFMPSTNSVAYLGERTEFKLRNSRTKQELSANDFKSVKWSVRDGSTVASGDKEFIGHEFTCVGNATISADMVCKHCGKKSTASITRGVVNRPIAVVLAFDPDGNVFRPGSVVKFVDKSTGRVKGRKWFIDGLAVKDDAKEIPFRLPYAPCEYNVNLVVCDSEGVEFLNGITNVVQLEEIAAAKGYMNKESEELVRGVYYHSCHVKEFKGRWGRVAALIILAVAVLVWLGIWKFFHGNEPRGWSVQVSFCTEEEALRTDVRRLHRVVSNGAYVDLKDTWSRWRKNALVPVRPIAVGLGRKAAGWEQMPEECKLEFKQSASAKQAFVLAGSKFLDRKTRELPPDMKGRTFFFKKRFGKKVEKEYLSVFVDGVRPSVATNYFLYVILPLALLGLAYYAMTQVAF